MAKDKVEAVLSWNAPASLTEVQSFLGFANFYWRFIKDYSKIARPLTELTKKGEGWNWTAEANKAFQELKNLFTTAPILAHFNAQKLVIIETDASDFVIGAILSQQDEDGRLHPVAFHSRKFQSAEINYEIHDKELLAVVDCHEPGATGSLAPVPVPLSPLSPCVSSSFPLPQPRSSSVLRCLDRSPPYRSGSDIPDRWPV